MDEDFKRAMGHPGVFVTLIAVGTLMALAGVSRIADALMVVLILFSFACWANTGWYHEERGREKQRRRERERERERQGHSASGDTGSTDYRPKR